jgi:hypothetical protein
VNVRTALALVVVAACSEHVGPPGPQGVPGPAIAAPAQPDMVLTTDGAGGTLWKSNASFTDLGVTSGRIGVNVAQPQTKLDIAVEDTEDEVQLRRYTSDTSPVKIDFVKAFGTQAAPQSVGAGTNIMALRAFGFDGAAFQYAAKIILGVDSGFAPGVAAPGRLQVSTADATGTLVERFRIDSLGHWVAPAQTAPVLTNCGAAATIVGTDVSGTITEGAGATGCTITFVASYDTGVFPTTPHCTVTSRAGQLFSYTTTPATIAITNIGALAQTVLDYTCIGS